MIALEWENENFDDFEPLLLLELSICQCLALSIEKKDIKECLFFFLITAN